MLRTPLIVTDLGQETGMLTGKANRPYVVLTSGTLSGPTSLRIRVVQDLRTDSLHKKLYYSLAKDHNIRLSY
jgi:hypothetical protein